MAPIVVNYRMQSTIVNSGMAGLMRTSWVHCMGYASQGRIEKVQPWHEMHPLFKALMSSKATKDIRGLQKIVFLGPPGVGKGTYAGRLGNLIKVPHIVMGDLVRNEILHKTVMAQHLKKIMDSGQLLPDEVIFNLLTKRLDNGLSHGELGFILDGFPRTLKQTKILHKIANIDAVVNLQLREDVLLAKCLGRRKCSQCGSNFNVADVNVDGIHIPTIMPPPSCISKMTTRADDIEEVVCTRMRIYHKESRHVEEFYRSQGKLLDFDVCGDISVIWPRLLSAMHLEDKSRLISQGSQRMIKSIQCMK